MWFMMLDNKSQILIAHRGNTNGPNPDKENRPEYILEALSKKYNVEVDVWYWNDEWWLGHDKPQYPVEAKFVMLTPYLWVHCKNADAMDVLCASKALDLVIPAFFWHETDTYTLVSNGTIWTYPGKPLTNLSICVKPESATYTDEELRSCFGICSDYIQKYKDL